MSTSRFDQPVSIERLSILPMAFALVLMLLVFLFQTGCQDAQVLSPEPSALDLDDLAPSCPGLTSVTVSAGPSLTVEWGEAADTVSSVSN